MIGAGGVGKAIAFALATLGVGDVRLFDSDAAKSRALAAAVPAHAARELEDAHRRLIRAHLEKELRSTKVLRAMNREGS